MNQLHSALEGGLARLGLAIDADAAARLIHYLRLLERWNGAYNLTASGTLNEWLERHVLDSLKLLPYMKSGSLLDVGSGAGLPGIPLAIAEPSRPTTLLDSNGKKTRFLEFCCAQLRLECVEVSRQRIEGSTPSRFDVVTARAVAPLATLLPTVAPTVKPGGRLLALKGERVEEELQQVEPKWHQHLELHSLPQIGAEKGSRLVVYHAPTAAQSGDSRR